MRFGAAFFWVDSVVWAKFKQPHSAVYSHRMHIENKQFFWINLFFFCFCFASSAYERAAGWIQMLGGRNALKTEPTLTQAQQQRAELTEYFIFIAFSGSSPN